MKKKNTESERMRENGYVRAAVVARTSNLARSTISEHCQRGNVESRKVGKTLYVLWASWCSFRSNNNAETARTLGLNPTKLPS